MTNLFVFLSLLVIAYIVVCALKYALSMIVTLHHPRRILLLRQRDHAALSGDYDYVGGQAEFHFPIIKLSYVTRRLARTAISAATERFPETL